MEYAVTVLIVAGSAAVSIICNMIASDLYDRSQSAARWLIRRAALCIPKSQRRRYEEEWLAHMNECSSKFGMLCHGVECFIAAISMARGLPKTVMIVEDNELNMKMFNDLLQAHGYETLAMRNGHEALDALRTQQPDLIVMDIQLPEISGLEVTRLLKIDPELKDIPVVAVTAFAMKGDEERIRQGGCDEYLSKPISVATFVKTVGRLTHRFR